MKRVSLRNNWLGRLVAQWCFGDTPAERWALKRLSIFVALTIGTLLGSDLLYWGMIGRPMTGVFLVLMIAMIVGIGMLRWYMLGMVVVRGNNLIVMHVFPGKIMVVPTIRSLIDPSKPILLQVDGMEKMIEITPREPRDIYDLKVTGVQYTVVAGEYKRRLLEIPDGRLDFASSTQK